MINIEFVKCSSCGEKVMYEAVIEDDDRIICFECLHKYFKYCKICDYLTDVDKLKDGLCKECYKGD